jgi:flagellar motor switch protein FliN/FliY
MGYLDCWISTASTLFAQMLGGEAKLRDGVPVAAHQSGFSFMAVLSGDVIGRFTVTMETEVLKAPLFGEAVDQASAWEEFLREVAGAAAGELMASSGQECRVEAFRATSLEKRVTRALQLVALQGSWTVLLHDETMDADKESSITRPLSREDSLVQHAQLSSGTELLLDVELEATLRFGCREMPLGEILELGPGDVIELDRHTADPADLVVGDKIIARGEVVLINGNFGLRVTEVAAPQKRLESIRCLF